MMVFAAAFQAACALTALAPVEEDTFLVDGIPMSNFLHPSWFEPFKHPPGTKFDLLGLLTKPFSMTKGARIGKAKAVTATARKIAVLFYNAVRYVDPGASFYETRYRARVIDNLHRRAKVFGFALHPLGPTPPAPFLRKPKSPAVHAGLFVFIDRAQSMLLFQHSAAVIVVVPSTRLGAVESLSVMPGSRYLRALPRCLQTVA